MNNLTEKRKRLAAKRKTSRQKEKDSRQKEKPHGKKKKTQSKKKIPRQKEKGSRQNFFDTERTFLISFAVRSWLFFWPWGYSFGPEVFLFCREVNSFSVTVVGHCTFEILFPKILDFSICGYSWEQAQTLLISFQAIQFMDWPVPKTLDISVCQTSQKWKQSFQNIAFCISCSSVVRGEEREHNLVSSPVSTFSAGSAYCGTMTNITTWEEMKVRVRRIHWEV